MRVSMLIIIIALLSLNLILLRKINDYPEMKLGQYKQSLLHAFTTGCNRSLKLNNINDVTRRYVCNGMESEYEKELNEVFE